jgi:hypothetical protein
VYVAAHFAPIVGAPVFAIAMGVAHTFLFDMLAVVVFPSLERVYASTDPARLRQILDNFVGNAIKYSDEGRIDVSVSRHDDGDDGPTVELSVSDQGIGIPAEELSTIFRRFYQVDGSITRSQGGVGLGLHVVERLAEVLGGKVSVVSDVGAGSTFGITLPALPDSLGAADANHPG